MLKMDEKIYVHGDLELKGFIARDSRFSGMRPGVMVFHDWSGCNDFAKERAQILAEQGYIAFAVDMYGGGRVGTTNEEKSTLMQPLLQNRQLLRERIQLTLKVFKDVPEVNSKAIAAIGFCFGGLCVLDLARTGADVNGVVSFHGLLHADNQFKTKDIQAKVLVLHGYDDPMVAPEVLTQFCSEMTAAKADWQLHAYGHTSHAFTNPLANDINLGLIYNPITAARAFQQMNMFFEEIL